MVSKQHDTWATNAVLAEQGYKHEIDAFIRRDRSNSSGPVGITLTATVVEASSALSTKIAGMIWNMLAKRLRGLGCQARMAATSEECSWAAVWYPLI